MNAKTHNTLSILTDPVKCIQTIWPSVKIYDKQAEILYSLRDNDETLVYAGNQLGKDFISALAVIWFFISRSPCRIITSSAGQTQLRSVLWGEMNNFLLMAKYPLPILFNDLLLRKELLHGGLEPKSYVRGIVTNTPENLQGHHLARGRNNQPRTLAVFDEASGISDEFKDATDTWAHRTLIIGNPLPCTNFFFRGAKRGDVEKDAEEGFHVKTIQIKATDSPNVRLGLAQKEAGKKVTHTSIVPGVLSYNDYLRRRKLWDPVRQCIGLDAEFYEGAEVLMFPPMWLNAAEERHREILEVIQKLKKKNPKYKRKAKAIGVDTAEGGDNTVWTVVDQLGIIAQYTKSTTDTSVIPNATIAYMKLHNCPPENVVFDSGGGGKQHADILRQKGYNVRNVGFGQAATRSDESQDQSSPYLNLRAEMYHQAALLIDPSRTELGEDVYGMPDKLSELRRQLAIIPLLYDQEGRIYLPPKDKPSDTYKGDTLRGMLGCSPDEADSYVLAIHGMQHPVTKPIATAF